MAWTATYQILRDRPLDDAELAALEELAARLNQPAWEGEGFGLVVTREARVDRVVGEGRQTLASDAGATVQRMCDALNTLAGAVSRIEVRVRDDVGALGMDPIAGLVRRGGAQGLAPVQVARDDRQWRSPGEWLTRFRALSPALAAFAAGGTAATGEALRMALVEIAKLPDDRPARAALVARLRDVPALELAQAGLEVYGEIARARTTWALVKTALEAIFDVTPLVDRFLAVWRAPRGVYWYSDLRLPDHTLDALATVPVVEAQMEADLVASLAGGDDELVHRRGEYAAQMLGRGRTASALASLLEAATRLHGPGLPAGVQAHTRAGVYTGLTIAAVPAVVPSLLLEVGTSTRWTRHAKDALNRLAWLAPARVAPIAVYLADAGESLNEVVPVLQHIGDAASIAALERLCAAPDPADRARAAEALRVLGGNPPQAAEPPPPERLVTHASGAARERALRMIDEVGDPALLTSFLAAVALDLTVRRRFDEGARAHPWKQIDRLPRPLRSAPLAEQLAWVRAEGSALPPQVVWPELAVVVDGKVALLSGSYPPPLPRLDRASEAALVAEEAELARAVRHGDLARLRMVDVTTPVGLVLASPSPGVMSTLKSTPPPVASAVTVKRPAPVVAASMPTVAAPAPAPAPAPAAPPARKFFEHVDTVIDAKEADVIDELLTALAREQPVSRELAAKAALPPAVVTMERWDRAKALRARLIEMGPAQVGTRVLARLPELHDGSNLQNLCEVTLPVIAGAPGMGARMAELWDEAHGKPWSAAHRITDYFEHVAAAPELFAVIVDELAAPDDGAGRGRTTSAFGLIGAAKEQRALATAAVVARVRIDRGKPREVVGWRGDAYKALRKLGSPDAVATAILELAEPSSPGKRPAELLELAARADRDLLIAAIDLPELSGDATRELCRGGLLGADGRERLMAHPFWRVRLAAAEANRDWKQGKAEVAGVWAAIDAAGLAVPAADRKAARVEPGTQPAAMAPLPPARDGLAAPCADLRAWALWAVDERCDPADLVARVFADELDRALVGLGHARVAARWTKWRAQVPELPIERRGRLAWAHARRDAALPAALVRVRDEGAAVVAVGLPRPHLVLTAAQREELLALEAPIAARGEALFRDGE